MSRSLQPEQQVQAILGLVTRAMIVAAGDNNSLGAFMQSLPQQIHEILGIQPASAEPVAVELQSIVSTAVHATLQALEPVPASPEPTTLAAIQPDLPIAKTSQTNQTNQAGAKTLKSRLTVLINGHRTSLSIDPHLVSRLKAVLGEKQMRTTMTEIAKQIPSSLQNRSAWVEDHLRATLEGYDFASTQPNFAH